MHDRWLRWRRRLHDVKKFLRLLAINVAATLLLLEVILQAIAYAGAHSANPLLGALYQKTRPGKTWQQYFLDTHQQGSLVYLDLFQPDPLLGWRLKPGVKSQRGDMVVTTNAQGYRALADFQDDIKKYQVMIVGDSFTFGDELSDTQTWPYLLAQQDARFNVFNLAGSGYGTDQMYLTLKQEIDHYHPDLVIAAFICEDLYRSTLSFRDYKKPRFELRDNRLVLGNTPIGSIDDVLREAQQQVMPPSPVQLVNLWRRFTTEAEPMETDHCDAACWQLNRVLFEQMQALATQRGAEFLMVYLPYAGEIRSDNFIWYGEQFFKEYQQQHSDAAFLDPRPQFLAAPFRKARIHYREPETRLVSELVGEKIRSLHSWQQKMAKPPVL